MSVTVISSLGPLLRERRMVIPGWGLRHVETCVAIPVPIHGRGRIAGGGSERLGDDCGLRASIPVHDIVERGVHSVAVQATKLAEPTVHEGHSFEPPLVSAMSLIELSAS